MLDLTRVIAGPVGTRMLAALGAEVLRVNDPRRPELASQAVEGVIGKASTLLDASTEKGAETLHELLDRADVLITGYRPGALRAFGLEPDQLSTRHPGTVVVTLSAWGTTGPWATRRGFDSLVQIASGIGWAVSRDADRPGTLPCQLLDHATGYLIAAGALAALTRRARRGQASHVHLSLAHTAKWLIDQGPRDDPRPATSSEADIAAYRVPFGNGWTGIGPPGLIDGRALTGHTCRPNTVTPRPAGHSRPVIRPSTYESICAPPAARRTRSGSTGCGLLVVRRIGKHGARDVAAVL